MSNLISENDKIYDIVKKYPQLIDVLLNLSPRFEKLKNPVIFNTVARVTTVKKASEVGKVYLNEMLYQLNDAIGKGEEFLAQKKSQIFQMKDNFLKEHFEKNSIQPAPKPAWLDKSETFKILDVRNDEQDPFLKINELAQSLKPGDGFILIQKFEPIPLITFLSQHNFEHYTQKISDDEFRIYFYKNK